MARPGDHRRRDNRLLLADAANKIRREGRTEQAAQAGGYAPIVPYARFTFAELLDELAYAVSRDDLPSGVRRVALDLAERILNE